MSPVYKPKIICENQAVLFLPLICFSLDKGFESGSGEPGMLVGEGQSISSSTPDFALQCNPVCLLPVSSPGYIDLHNSPQPHSVSAYESDNQTPEVFLWLLWAVSKATKSLPMPRTPLSSLVPSRPFGIPVFSTFHKALEVSTVK